MAIDSTITGLPTSTTPLDGSEVLPIDQNGNTKKTTILSVLNTIIQKIGLGTEIASANDGNVFSIINRLISTPTSFVKLFLSKTGDEASLTATDGTKLTTVSTGVNIVQMQAFDGANPAILFLTPIGQAITSNGSNNNFIVKDYISNKGLVNASDYSANFTPESLITKRYTDNTYALKLLTGYVSGAGTVAGTDTVLQAIQKLNGNIASIPSSTLTATQIAFGSSANAISSSSNFVVNTTTGNLAAPLIINVGGIPTGGYDIFNHFQMPEQLTAFKSTTNGKSSEIQIYNNLNALQFGVEGSINGNRMNGTLAYYLYFGCYYNYGITFHTNNLARGAISPSGKWFFGDNTTATAIVQIKAGTATAGTAPLKFTSGTNLTTVEDGSIEYDSTNFFASAKGTRQVMLKGLSGSFSGTGTATTAFTVTFGNTQPNTTYQVIITPTNALTAAVLYVTSKTTTTFTVTFLTGLTGTVAFDWVLIQ